MNKLRPFQAEGVRLIEGFHGRALLADEMGLGKTVQALYWLRTHKDALPAVVVCPAYLKDNWASETAHWSRRMVPVVLHGRKADGNYCQPHKSWGRTLWISNYDIILPTKKRVKKKVVRIKHTWTELLKKCGIRTVIIDEGHYIKNKSTLRARGVVELCEAVPHLLILTGTPVENRPFELWYLLHLLVPGLFRSRWRFGQEFCDPRYNGFGWEFKGATKPKKLHRLLIKHCMIRRMKKDVLKDLPAKQYADITVSLPSKFQKEYDAARTDFKAWLEARGASDEAVERSLRGEALTRMGALLQIAAMGKVPTATQWVLDTLEQEPAVVLFTVHVAVARGIAKALRAAGVKARSVTGQTKNVQELVNRFQSGKLQVLVGTFKRMGTGVTLTRASQVGIVELPWSPGVQEQGADRLHRIGQTKAVNVWRFIATGTHDEDLVELLREKQKNIDAVLTGHKVRERVDVVKEMFRRMRR